MTTTNTNPYIGPRTFQENERDRFFGRELEADELLALVVSEQLVLFYAQSGAGKSSLVNTCLAPDLKEQGLEVLRGRVGGDAPFGCEPRNIFVFNLLRSLAPVGVNLDTLTEQSLSQFLTPKMTTDPDSGLEGFQRRALIIDQFEEIFSTHHEAWMKRRDFFEQLCQVLHSDPRLHVLLVMREDFIASLDPYANIFPNRLRMRYYMQQLGYEAALKAVKEPVKKQEFSRPYEQDVAEQLVNDLRTIKVIKPDGSPGTGEGQFVEPLYLQVICYELWNNLPSQGPTITKQNVKDVGDVSTALGNYYSKRVETVAQLEKISEAKIRKWFTDELISSTGIRSMVLQEMGETSAGLENRVIAALSDLIRGEQRGSSTFYELTHDRLVEPIITSNKNWFDAHLSPLQKQAALWMKEGKNDSWLLADQALVEVQNWADEHRAELTEVEDEFLEVCHNKQAERKAQQELENSRKRAQNARQFSLMAGLLTVIAVIATVLAVGQAKTSLSGQLSAYALSKLNSQPDLAILLSLESDRLHNDIHSRNALLTMQQENAHVQNFLPQDLLPSEAHFTPDGRIMAIRNEEGIVLWDMNSLNRLTSTPINGHFSEIAAFAISSDGKLMASGATDGTIVVWDAVERKKLSSAFEAHKGVISNLAINPQGTVLASASWEEASIILWDLEDPANPKQKHKLVSEQAGSIYSVAFSKDGKLLASGSGDGSIVLWDAESYKQLTKPLTAQQETIAGLEFSPDGKTLASGSWDDTVMLWNVSEPQKPVQIGETLIGEIPNDVEVVAFSPDGKTLAAGDDNGDILLWDVSDPEHATPLESLSEGNPAWVISLAFSVDGDTIVSGRSDDGSVTVWNLEAQEPKTFSAHGFSSIPGVAISADEKTLITASWDSSIKFWNLSDPDDPQLQGETLRGHPNGMVNAMEWSADGSILSSSGSDGNLLLLPASQDTIGYGTFIPTNPAAGVVAYQTTSDAGAVTVHIRDIASGQITDIPLAGINPILSPNGKILVYQTVHNDHDESMQSQLHLWDVSTNQELSGLLDGDLPTFSPDSELLIYQASGAESSGIGLWNISKAQSVGDPIPGSYIAISPDSKMLVYQTNDPETLEPVIELWEIGRRRAHKSLLGADFVGVSPDGEFLAFKMFDASKRASSIHILNTTTGEDVTPEAILNLAPEMQPTSATLSKAGQILTMEFVSGDSYPRGGFMPYSSEGPETQIAILDLSTGSLIGDIVKGSYRDQTKDGKILVYQTTDKNGNQINLLDTASKLPIGNPIRGEFLTSSADGKTVVARNENGLITLWNVAKTWPLGDLVSSTPEKISRATLSLDGNSLAWIAKDGIGVENLSTGTLLGEPFNNHLASNIWSVLFDPNERFLILGGEGGYTSFWDPRTHKQIGTTIEASPSSFATLSADGRILVVRDFEDETTSLWDTSTQSRIGDDISGSSAALSSDGKLLAVGSYRTSTTTIWDLTSYQQIGAALPGTDPQFSSDGKILAVGDQNTYTITLWKSDTLEKFGVDIPGESGMFNAAGTLFAAYDYQNSTTTLWDLESFKPVGAPLEGIGRFSPDGKLLAVSSDTTTLWDISDPYNRRRMGRTTDGEYTVFNATGSMTAVINYDDQGNNKINIWTLRNFGTTPINAEPITSDSGFAFSPNGDTVAYDDGTSIVLWSQDSQTRTEVPLDSYSGTVGGLSFNDTGNVLAVFGDAGVVLWDMEQNKPIGDALQGPVIPGTDLVISPDGKMLASYAADGIILRNLQTGEDIHLETGEFTGQLTNMMSFYADGTRFVAVGQEYTDVQSYSVLTWDLTKNELTEPEEIKQFLKNYYISNWKFTPDGNYLAYVQDVNVSIWDIVNNKPYGSAADFADVETYVGAVNFSQDGKWMVYSDGPKILLWDVENKTPLDETLLTDSDVVTQLNVIMNGEKVQFVISVDESNNTQIWDWENRTKIGNPMTGNLQIAGLNPEKRMVYYIDSAGKLIQWQWGLDLAGYKNLMCPLVRRNLTEEEWKIYFPVTLMWYPSQRNRTCPDYDAGIKITAAELTSLQVTATSMPMMAAPTGTPVSLSSVQSTALPTSIVMPATPIAVASATAAPSVDIESQIQAAKILVYEDTAAEGLWIQPILKQNGYKNATYVFDRLGDFKIALTSTDTKWDLIIVAAESTSGDLGEYWDHIRNQIEQGTPVIIETRSISEQGEGRMKSILDSCGVAIQSNLELAVPLKWYAPDHPIFNTPNQVTEFSRMNRVWDQNAGDLLKLTPGSQATILAGTKSTLVDSGVIVNCYDGRLILQTFSNHDYPREQVSELWENYIYNLLYNHFAQ